VVGVTDDVGQQVLPVGLGHHLAVHIARSSTRSESRPTNGALHGSRLLTSATCCARNKIRVTGCRVATSRPAIRSGAQAANRGLRLSSQPSPGASARSVDNSPTVRSKSTSHLGSPHSQRKTLHWPLVMPGLTGGVWLRHPMRALGSRRCSRRWRHSRTDSEGRARADGHHRQGAR
jgi:hypothetical protein